MYKSYVSQAIALFVVAILTVTGVQTAEAQAVWKQDIEVLVPIERGSSIAAFRDALIEHVEENEDAMVQRRSTDQNPQDISSIESELISDGWGGLMIANTLYIRYEFTEGRDGFRERITSVNFLRQQDGGGPDVPVFYMNTDGSTAFNNFLRREGVRASGFGSNTAHEQPFRDILLFGRLMRMEDEAKVTEINDESVNVEDVDMRTQQIVDQIIRISLASR